MSKQERHLELNVQVGAMHWPVLDARIEEGMSEVGGAWVQIAAGQDLDLEPLVEETATLIFLWAGQETRRFTMQLARGRFLDEREGHLCYELELRPALWFLGLDKNLRKFRDLKTEAIVDKILGEGGVAHEWRNRRQSTSRPYTVQYRETHLDFVRRLLEFEGFYFTFDPDGTMVIGDTSSASPEVPGAAEYTLIDVSGALKHGAFGVTSFERGAVVSSGRATVNDYNWKTPALPLLASQTGQKDTFLEVYDYPTGYRDPGQGKVLARLRLEALEAQKRVVTGTATAPAFAVGHLFTFEHEEAVSFSGRYLLVHIEHHYHSDDKGASYENTFRATPASVPFRPAVVTPTPYIQGNHTAMVRGPVGEEIHTDAWGRAKVQFHWDREAKGTDEDSRWIRTAQEVSTSIALSRVGWEISVGYIDGDPDRPVGYARQINGQMVPMYNQPAFKNRMTIRTETYPGKQGFNELRMEDSSGAMTMDWHAQKDFKNVILNDRTETIGQNLTVLIQRESSRVVEKNQSIAIGGDQKRTVGRDVVVKVELDRKHTIDGDETITIAQQADTSVVNNDTEDVSGTRTSTVGNSESGSIDRSVTETFLRTVGGSQIVVAKGSIAHQGGEMLYESAGGTKLTVATEQSIKQSVEGKLDTVVDGLVLRKSKDDMSVSAKKTEVSIGASMTADSGERVELRSKEIELQASASITLSAGGLSIAMTPAGVTIVGPLKEKSGTKITVRGNPDKLTPLKEITMARAYVELAVQGIEARRVLSMRGTEAVSTLFRYDVEVEIDLPLPDADEIIGAEVTLRMRDTAHHERVVTGVVAEATAQAYDNHRGRAALVIRPAVWRQSLGRDCYASQDVTVRQVVDDVLSDYTGQYRWELTRSYPTYPYRVQYREDDWTYVSRLLEEEGIYYWFDHEASSVLVLSDNSTSAPDMTGGALLPWVREAALLPERDAITELGSTSAASTGRFEQRSFDSRRPLIPIQAKAGAGKHEVYDAPGGGTGMEAILTARVHDQREANIAAHAGSAGRAHSIRPAPGFVFDVTGHPLGKLDGRWLVTGVEVSGSDHQPCKTHFTALRAEVPFRPLRVTPEAKQAGLQLGNVIGPEGQEVHPDDLARVRVILHWDRLGTHDEKGGTWMRVAQRGAPGSMLFPRMGWNVATFNEEGTVDAPSVIWRIHDGEHVPEYQLPMNMTRVVWKTATVPANGTTNEMYFEDKAGGEEMFINASRDMTYRVLDAKYETVRNDSWRTIGANHDLTIHESLDERVIQDQQITIGGNEKVTVSGARMKTVTGNEQEKVGGTRKIKVGKSHLAHVQVDRTLIVGGSMVDICQNNINLTAKDATTVVSGSVVKMSNQDISEAAAKDTVQVISGSKLESAQRDRALVVRQEWTEKVGGSVFLISNNKYLDTADTTSLWTIKAALAASAPEVHIEAVDSIRFTCGDSVLTVTPKAITVTAASLNLSGAKLDADSGIIEHN